MQLSCVFRFFFVTIFFLSSTLFAKEIWVLDKELSTIHFELPVLFAKKVKGEFKKFEGLVEINPETKKNKAIFSVNLDSIEMNYQKYKKLILSNIFFNTQNFPIALLDTKKFSYENEDNLILNVELIIKGISHIVPVEIEINFLAEELIQIKSELTFSRTAFQIGTGKWSSTTILKDKGSIKTNLFLFKE